MFCFSQLQFRSGTNHCHIGILSEGEDAIIEEVSETFSSGINSKQQVQSFNAYPQK